MSNRLPVIAAEIRQAHADSRTAANRSAERAIAAGHLLIEAKRTVRHGEWVAWLHGNVSMSERTARRYMQLAASGLKSATVAEMGIRGAAEAIAKPRPEFRDLIADVETTIADIRRAEILSGEWVSKFGSVSEAVELRPLWEAAAADLHAALRKLDQAVDVASSRGELNTSRMWAEISAAAASIIAEHSRRAVILLAEATR